MHGMSMIAEARFIDNGDGTLTDRERGLMWMRNDSWVETQKILTWHDSQNYARQKNAEKFAGYDDWRIPTASEAKSLYDDAKINTDKDGCEIHIDPLFSPGCGFTTWTSETRAAKQAMGYDYRADYEFWLAKENEGFPSAVRLARTLAAKPVETSRPADETGEQPKRLADNGDGTVSDLTAGLMWKKTDSFLDLDKWLSWEEARAFVQDLNKAKFARYADWRVPTRKEAMSIFDRSHPTTDFYGDTIYIAAIFPPGAGATTWTSTVHKTENALAMRFFYYNGDYKWHQKGLRSHGVRPVRTLKK
jgi:hypothetical protein